MPWTIAHAAAVLPLRRWSGAADARMSFAGLCIGSFAPDFGYYLPFVDRAGIAHTPIGIALVCVPAGLVLWVLLRWLHAPVAELLPQPHRSALLALPRVDSLVAPRAWAVAALSIALGALTHIVWDSFTHAHRGLAEHSAWLHAPLLTVFGREWPAYAVLQHLSTLLGTVCLIVAYRGHLRRHPHTPAPGRGEALRKLGLAAMLAGAAAAAALIALATGDNAALRASPLIVRWVVWTTTLLVIALTATALLGRALRAPRGA
jgi:hypothetical protein